MPSIFISYRRADSRTHAGRIHDRLVAEFGHDAVFKDVDDIPDGAVFPKLLQETLKNTDILLAVIGPRWATVTDSSGSPRLHDPNDFTRMEIEAGLAREACVVIPLLVDGATMPSKHDLPESLQPLTDRNARIIRDDPDFHADMDRLIRRLHELARKPAPEPVLPQQPISPVEPAPVSPARPDRPPTDPLRKRRRWLMIAALFGVLAFVTVTLMSMYEEATQNPWPTLTDRPPNIYYESLGPRNVTPAPEYWDGSRSDLGVAKRFDSENCLGFTPDDRYAYGADWIYYIDNDEIILEFESTEIVISPDGSLAAVAGDGLYRLDDGVRLFSIGDAPKFSADGRYLVSDEVGIHDIANERLIRNARDFEEYSAISARGRLIVSHGMPETSAFVFDMQTGETVLQDTSGHGFDEAQFSDSGSMLAIAGVGVYQMPDGEPFIEGDVGTTFDSYSISVAGGSIVADVLAKLVLLRFDEPRRAFFTPDSSYLAVEYEGVYDVRRREKIFDLPDDAAITLSHDGRHVAVQSLGWYSIPEGQLTRIDDVGENPYDTPPIFSRDDNVVAFDGVGVYGVETGKRLAAYPHDFVAFGITRPLILVEVHGDDAEGCMMLADSGAFSDVEPLE